MAVLLTQTVKPVRKLCYAHSLSHTITLCAYSALVHGPFTARVHCQLDVRQHTDHLDTFLTSFAWGKWLKTFGDIHRIRHFHVAMIKGIIYTNYFAFSVPLWALTKIAKLVCITPLIIATCKWWIIKFSLNVSATFLMQSLLRIILLAKCHQLHTHSAMGPRQIPLAESLHFYAATQVNAKHLHIVS